MPANSCHYTLLCYCIFSLFLFSSWGCKIVSLVVYCAVCKFLSSLYALSLTELLLSLADVKCPFIYFCYCIGILLLFSSFLIFCMLSFLTQRSFCYGTTAVQDDAAPGTQEYIMLRQDSIHSADIRSKGSPFRAKCHEIFCCPLKQVVLKESAVPEGLSATHPCFDLPILASPSPLPSYSPHHILWTDSTLPLPTNFSLIPVPF